MNLLKIKYVFFLLITGTLFQSCSKFTDGPLISLRTKKQRIVGEWKIEYSVNLKTNVKHSADYDAWIFSIKKDGSFTNTIYYGDTETSINGSWIFIDNQIKLEQTNKSGEIQEFYTILRLTKKEFWIKNKVEEIHYYSE